jgi:2-polyprenyl-3-methyl-5-hydroxy-6-metoxy-1,4-benzoquinol methylase
VDLFTSCEICGSDQWAVGRRGVVRDGAFGRSTDEGAVVAVCGGCRVERLAEGYCRDDSIYESDAYRSLLKQGSDAESFFSENDHLQHQNLSAIWPNNLRGKVVADVGCAAGSFLDHISGLAARTIAIEPCRAYHDSLRQRGHTVLSDLQSAAEQAPGSVDFATCFSVIEHVGNPRAFLADIRRLLRPAGTLLVSTPNRRDVLMQLLPDCYPAFFYRTVHRWYFDIDSFTRCAELAELRVTEVRCIHRFGLSNAMLWMRDRRPSGRASALEFADPVLDHVWRGQLESSGRSDYLYFSLTSAAK